MNELNKDSKEQELKFSIYNDFVDLNGRHFLVNYLTGNIIELDDPHYAKLKTLKEGAIVPDNLLDREDIEFLKERRFVVEEEFDEKEFLKYVWKRAFSGTSLKLLIELTRRCNFACTYCFEDALFNGTMREEHQKRLLKFVERYIEQHGLSSLHVVWFGGEPLLVPRVIDKLTQGFKQIFAKIGLDFAKGYSATLVTNGSLLDRQMVESKLTEWGIKTVQITIDGSEEVHNLRRPFKGGKPSFQVVWQNFMTLLNYINDYSLDIAVILRINFSADVKEKVVEILDMVPSNLRKLLKVTYKHYFPKSSQWVGEVSVQEPSTPVNLIEAELSKIAHSKGYESEKLELNLRRFYCEATTNHYFEILPNLDVYKCNVSAGVRPPVGVIDEEGNLVYKFDELLNWVNVDPFEDKECLECKLLPLCMGGCGFARLSGGKGCIVDREIYKEIVKLEIQKMI